MKKNILRKIKPANHYCAAGAVWTGCKFPYGLDCPGGFTVVDPRDG